MKDNNSFKLTICKIRKLLHKYSIHDISKSFFVLSLWLPNIAGSVKLELLVGIFLSSKKSSYSFKNKILKYEQFYKFINRLIPLLPDFPIIEDYIPECDWGEIKFQINKTNYKIFYGNSVETQYDFLTLFIMLYKPFENEIQELTNNSPIKELEFCLRIQNDIIEDIENKLNKESKDDIKLGYLEIPLEEFWDEACKFYEEYDLKKYPSQFLNKYTERIGHYKLTYCKDDFINLAHSGKLITNLFVKYNNKFYPLLPRDYFGRIFDYWGSKLKKTFETLDSNNTKFKQKLGIQIYDYVNKRIKNKVFCILSVSNKLQEKPYDLLFPLAFQSGDNIFFIYVLSPSISIEFTKKEIDSLKMKVKRANEIFSKSHIIFSYLDNHYIQFKTNRKDKKMIPQVFVLLPIISLELFALPFYKPLPFKLFFLEQFLSVIDEIDDIEDFQNFLEYMIENKRILLNPLTSLTDIYASYKDSHSVIIEGAISPDLLVLDPHWGSNFRYESLKRFWRDYPPVDFFDDPRTWVPNKETKSRTRLNARGFIGCAIYTKIGELNIFLTSPFEKMNYEQSLISNLILEALEDILSHNENIIKKHEFFQMNTRLEVLFFPDSMVIKKNEFKHLLHLHCSDKSWNADSGQVKKDLYAIRIVFNDKILFEEFVKTKDRHVEVELLVEILNHINNFCIDSKTNSIIMKINQQKGNLARYKLHQTRKFASFPDHVRPIVPKSENFKSARKRIAELINDTGIKKGTYKLDTAKEIINRIILTLLKEIDSEILKYNYEKSLKYLISNIDALIFTYEIKRESVTLDSKYDIDYKPEELLSKNFNDYIKGYKNYRFIIEKFIQLTPKSELNLDESRLKYLIAFVDWFQVFQFASDSIHYGLYPAKLIIRNDYIAEIEYKTDIKSYEIEFSKYIKKIELDSIRISKDKSLSIKLNKKHLTNLDQAFNNDMNFNLKNMLGILQILSFWQQYNLDSVEKTCYIYTKEEIIDVCKKNIHITKFEILKILDFLTIKSEKILYTIDKSEPHDTIPVWEYNKRPYRYTIKPLILINNKYYWGACSTKATLKAWDSSIISGKMPYDLESPSVKRIIRQYLVTSNDNLVIDTHHIISKYTSFAFKELELHKVKPKGMHPSSLGDYDVLAFIKEKNIILNVECKDNFNSYCMKDAKRLRDKIFGRTGYNDGHFRQIRIRTNYLKKNIKKVCQSLNWQIENTNLPLIITLYISNRFFWWMKYPPRQVDAEFIRVDLLDSYIKRLHRNTSSEKILNK